jgi:hypothetical protein
LFDANGDGSYDSRCFEWIFVRGPSSEAGSIQFAFGKGNCSGEVNAGLAQVNGMCIPLGTGGSQNTAGPIYFAGSDTIRIFVCDNSSGEMSLCDFCVLEASCEAEFTINRTWTATDDCGNSSTCEQTIKIRDDAPPVISALPAPTTIECPATPSFTIPTATDECDDMPSLSFNDVSVEGPCAGDYSVTRTWTATDACGNASTASQTINVHCSQQLDVKVFLEGPYDAGTETMSSLLNYYHLLPGQDPELSMDFLASILGTPTAVGQPYSIPPWNHMGTEGDGYGDVTTNPGSIPYPATVTDWVLVSIRTLDLDPGSTVWKCAGLLHEDGTVEIPADCPCLDLEPETNYHILVEHRNHLAVMSYGTMLSGNTLANDFTTTDSWKFDIGSPQEVTQKLIGGKYVMYGANGDQVISRTEIISADNAVWIGQNSQIFIYRAGDHDLNADVNSIDRAIWIPNVSLFNFIQH